jgi:hypothetical protein
MGKLLTSLGLPVPAKWANSGSQAPAVATAASTASTMAASASAGSQAAAKPVSNHAPSPEAAHFTKSFKDLMAKVAALEAARSADAPRLRKAALDAAKLAAHPSGVAAAMTQLTQIDKQLEQARTAAAEAAAGAAAPQGQRYNLRVGSRQLTNATKAETCKALKIELDRLEGNLKNGFEAHCEELKIVREEPFAAWISQGVSRITGGQPMPELEIWDDARDVVIQARRALKQEDIDALVPMFATIARSTQRGLSQIRKYNADVIDAAGSVVEAAKATQEAAVTVLTKGAERMGGKPAGVAMAGAANAVFKAAEELSAVHIAQTKKKVDWGAVAKEGAAGFASEMVGHLLHGFLAPRFSQLFGAWLGKAGFSEPLLKEMGRAAGLAGPMPRDYFATAGQKFVSAFLTSRAENLVKDAVAKAIKGKSEEDASVSVEEFMKKVLAGFSKGKLIDEFAEFVVKNAVK